MDPKVEEKEKKEIPAEDVPAEGAPAEGEEKKSKQQQKREAKAAEKAAANAEKKAKTTEEPAKTKKKEDEVLDPVFFHESRSKVVQAHKIPGHKLFPYPHKFHVSHQLPDLEEHKNKEIEKNVFLADEVRIAGRINVIRNQSKKLTFIDLVQSGAKVQVILNESGYKGDQFEEITDFLRRGDIIGVVGHPGRSRTGEFSIMAESVTLLTPCLYQVPTKLTNHEVRYRQRYLDMIVNESTTKTFITRSKVLSHLRGFFNGKGFLEVETPTLNVLAGGATARPFKTTHLDLNLEMYMRVAPELFLKMLVVGGMDRVFEIGKNFRNEQMDQTHNPEFTACEAYIAYADYNDLVALTEELLSGLVMSMKGSYKFNLTDEEGKEVELDFTPPFRKVRMIDELEKHLGEKIPTDLNSEEARKFLDAQAVKHGVDCSNPRSPARLLDKVKFPEKE